MGVQFFFADKQAKFADEILLQGQKRLVFETQYFPLGWHIPPHPTVATAMEIIKALKMTSYHASYQIEILFNNRKIFRGQPQGYFYFIAFVHQIAFYF